ncbi:MAG: DUF58 domain-containing protein [Pseudomonadota bacterium]|nr:DUF58 domain-containing protein [Pseudomonadota bacterium]
MMTRAERLASELPPLLVAAERVARSVALGIHGRRRVGAGETFWQFRRYQPGDSMTRIDWRRTGRSEHIYVREHEWEAAQSVWLWRDGSRSMDWSSRRAWPEKRDRAELLLLALATLLVRAGEYVAYLGSGRPPAGGRIPLLKIATDLTRINDTNGLPPAFRPLPSYARVVLLSDFLESLPTLEARLKALTARGVRGHLVQVLDPAEEALPFKGRVLFRGLEAEGDEIIPRVQSIRHTYGERMAAHRAGMRDLVRALGWSMTVHRSDESPESALLALYAALAEV